MGGANMERYSAVRARLHDRPGESSPTARALMLAVLASLEAASLPAFDRSIETPRPSGRRLGQLFRSVAGRTFSFQWANV